MRYLLFDGLCLQQRMGAICRAAPRKNHKHRALHYESYHINDLLNVCSLAFAIAVGAEPTFGDVDCKSGTSDPSRSRHGRPRMRYARKELDC